MTRINDTTTDILPPCAGAEGCTQPVVVVILSGAYKDYGQDVTTACAGHAPEVVHETRQCAAPDEYVILVVPRGGAPAGTKENP